MAENVPNIPTGAVPPKKETGKVQPKKETVRINLPPKPSTAPTIKLPTLPPGGPTGAASAPAAAAPAAAPMAFRPPAAAPAPMAAAQKPGVGTAAPRPAASPKDRTVSGLDVGLALAAAILGLVAVGTVVYLQWFIVTN